MNTVLRNRRATLGVVLLLVIAFTTPGSPAQAAYSQKTLAVTHYQQNQSNWCWVAAAKVVIHYFTGTTVSQCTLVDSQYSVPTGCPNIGGYPNQVENIVDSYLASIGKGGDWDAGSFSSSRLMNEINGNRPMIVDVQWKSNGNKHMFTVYGYDTSSGADTHVYVSNYSGPTGTGTNAKREVHNFATFSDNSTHTVLRHMRVVGV